MENLPKYHLNWKCHWRDQEGQYAVLYIKIPASLIAKKTKLTRTCLMDRASTSQILSEKVESFERNPVSVRRVDDVCSCMDYPLGDYNFGYSWHYITDRSTFNVLFNDEPGLCLHSVYSIVIVVSVEIVENARCQRSFDDIILAHYMKW